MPNLPDGSNPPAGRIISSALIRSNPRADSPGRDPDSAVWPGVGRQPSGCDFRPKLTLFVLNDSGMSNGKRPGALRKRALSYSIRLPMLETTVKASDIFRKTCLARFLVSNVLERNAPARKGCSRATAVW